MYRRTRPIFGPGGLGYPPNMDPERARQLIVNERERLESLVREREAEGIGTETETETISELSSFDQHQGDIGTETFEREKDYSLLEQIEAEIGDLDAALRKIDEGTYGFCEVCGREIDADRLEAMPGTRTCIDHAGAR
jgi:RNA polymerase-binding transcription factor DksA